MATSDVRYFLQDLSHTTFSRGCLEGTPNGLSGTQGSKIHFRLWLPFPRFFLSLFPSFFLFLSQRRLETKKVGCLRFSPSSSVLSFSLPLAPPPTVKANKLLVNPRPLIGCKGAGGSQSEGEDVGKGASCCCCLVRKMQIVSGGMQSKPLNYFVESLIESARFSGTVAKG